jgi:toxin YhaV
MEANGWALFQYPLFEDQLHRLTATVAQLAAAQPETYREHPATKLLATIHRYITEIIPRDPGAPEFRPRKTLGPDNRHWLRAKFHKRFQLFFRFSQKGKVIVYVWVNDESALQKADSVKNGLLGLRAHQQFHSFIHDLLFCPEPCELAGLAD